MQTFRVIIAGCRGFTDYDKLCGSCDHLLYDKLQTHHVIIISGHAAGADALGERYALEHGIDMELYPAEWTKYGRMAGAIRNDEMASSSDALIAFWDGKSRGTKIMIEKARKKGLTVTIVDVG